MSTYLKEMALFESKKTEYLRKEFQQYFMAIQYLNSYT